MLVARVLFFIQSRLTNCWFTKQRVELQCIRLAEDALNWKHALLIDAKHVALYHKMCSSIRSIRAKMYHDVAGLELPHPSFQVLRYHLAHLTNSITVLAFGPLQRRANRVVRHRP